MSEPVSQSVSIAVDLKKYRIRIHKSTLDLIGNPNYIQLLVSPSQMTVAVQGIGDKTPAAHRVGLSRLRTANSFELYSTLLITKLRTMAPDLSEGYCYRLVGKAYPEQQLALFSLKNYEKTEYEGELEI